MLKVAYKRTEKKERVNAMIDLLLATHRKNQERKKKKKLSS